MCLIPALWVRGQPDLYSELKAARGYAEKLWQAPLPPKKRKKETLRREDIWMAVNMWQISRHHQLAYMWAVQSCSHQIRWRHAKSCLCPRTSREDCCLLDTVLSELLWPGPVLRGRTAAESGLSLWTFPMFGKADIKLGGHVCRECYQEEGGTTEATQGN